jgi:two-component sensor histidine kinase
MHPDDICPLVETLETGKHSTVEHIHYDSTGSKLYVEVSTTPIIGNGGEIHQIIHLSRDITDRKRAEEEMAIIAKIGRVISSSLDIDEVYESFITEARKLIHSDRISVTVINPDGKSLTIAYMSGINITYRRPGAIMPIAGSVSEIFMQRQSGLIIHTEGPEDFLRQFPGTTDFAIIQEGIRSMIGIPLISRDRVIGSLLFLSRKSNAYTEQDLRLAERIGDQIAGAIGSAQFYNARKQAEDKIKGLLAEKELLLKEVHHRIKNNMNVIMSLLSLQSSMLKNSLAISSLEDARGRVQNMMVLYDKLYQSDDFRAISAKEYLTSLIDEIVGNFTNRGLVKIEKQIDDCILDAKTLSPVGMILNELITNAMKYAFAGREDGLIRVSFAVKDNHATLIIQDNGIGIPESIDITTSAGFGMLLIGMLTKQLQGTVRLERQNGSTFILEFDV